MQQLDLWMVGQQLVNDNDLTKKPVLNVDSGRAQSFLKGPEF